MQAYALQNILEKLGHQAFILNIFYWGDGRHNALYLFLYKMYFLCRKRFSSEYVERKYLNRFIKKELKQKYYFSFSSIEEKDFDAIIVGSDQIWREIFSPRIENTYLDFTTGWKIKRISYAASFGTDIWSYSKVQTQNCKALLALFDSISVRELSAVRLLQDNMGIESKLVLDPTLLFTSDDYCRLLSLNKNTKKGYMLSYILEENEHVNMILDAISKDKNLTKKCIYPERHYMKTLPSLEEWLQSLLDAEFIFTDSFHVSVFSIIFGKPFLFIKNEIAGNTRVESLMEILNIKDHMISEQCDALNAVYLSRSIGPIDASVISNLNVMRADSISFLKKALNN